MEGDLNFYEERIKNLDSDKDYLELKNIIQKYDIKVDDFLRYRLRYNDNKIDNLNYGMKAWYSGYYLESFRNFMKSYLQAKQDGDDNLINLCLSNISFCDNKWSNEKIEFHRKEKFLAPYHHYLKRSDIYVFTSHHKNVLREFIWKVCYHASIINPRWKIIFMEYDNDVFYFYFEVQEGKYQKFFIDEKEDAHSKEFKTYLVVKSEEKWSDLISLIALSNFIITNSDFYR